MNPIRRQARAQANVESLAPPTLRSLKNLGESQSLVGLDNRLGVNYYAVLGRLVFRVIHSLKISWVALVERFEMKRLLSVMLLSLAFSSVAHAGLMTLANLESISFFERSSAGGPDEFIFAFDSAELTTRLPDPLSAGNRDFIGTTFGADENYDVFYSDSDGTFNASGDFVTVTADYDFAGDSGMNIAEVRLNFSSGPGEFANTVTDFVALGTSPLPATVGNAVDGDLDTHTFLGDTVGQTTQRLSLTVGFASIPEPSPLLCLTLVALCGGMYRFRTHRRRT